MTTFSPFSHHFGTTSGTPLFHLFFSIFRVLPPLGPLRFLLPSEPITPNLEKMVENG